MPSDLKMSMRGAVAACALIALHFASVGSDALATGEIGFGSEEGFALTPGSAAPPFEVPTLDGSFTYHEKTLQDQSAFPIVMFAYDKRDAMSEAMFNPSSVDRFLGLASGSTQFLFLCHCETRLEALETSHFMRDAVVDRLHTLEEASGSMESWKGRLHFATEPVDALPNWLPGLFEDWNTTVRLLDVHFSGKGEGIDDNANLTTQSFPRLDGHFGWLPHAPSGDMLFDPMIVSEDLCMKNVTALPHQGQALLSDSDGPILVLPWSRRCTFAELLQKAESFGTSSVILYPESPTQSMEEISCEGSECDVVLNISASMVSYSSARELINRTQSGKKGSISFTEEESKGRYAAINASGRLQEVGWPVWPWLATLSWSAQYMIFQHELHMNLKQSDQIIEVFNGSTELDGFITAEVAWSEEELSTLVDREAKLSLDMSLQCTGKFDYSCPSWDHVIRAYACCGEDKVLCSPCPPLVWGSNGNEAAEAENGVGVCGPEIGRWITPFRRGAGHWLTDVTDLKGVFLRGKPANASQTCQITMQSVSWASTGDYFWLPKLNLRVQTSPSPFASTHRASVVTPQVFNLFKGGTFDKNYNTRDPFLFATPGNLARVRIHAVITGHGYDNNGCAEFCSGITNHFLVNGNVHTLEFETAGTQLGCTEQVPFGSEPNEHGTWFYGRNGWCDGQDVKPWVIDITTDMRPVGELNTIEYAGLYQGNTPDPTANPGAMLMSSFLVVETFEHQ